MHKRNSIGIAIFLVCVVIIAGFGIYGLIRLGNTPTTTTLQGTIEAPEVRIAGKLTGRLSALWVSEGDFVARGDTLTTIYSPETEAQYTQAHSMAEAAMAQSRKVEAGTRSEIIASAREMWLAARSQLQLAEQSYGRIERLWRDSVVSLQRKEEAEALYLSAKANERAAHQSYLMARKGAQKEDIQSAAYVAEAAEGTTEQVEAVLADTFLRSPTDGVVADIYTTVGELVGPGTPLLSLVRLAECYVVLNVREDLMPHFQLGQSLRGRVPAIGGTEVDWQIYYISPLGSYATWRSAPSKDSYDMRTFEIRARPQQPHTRLYPGMSVIVELPQ